MRTVAFFHFQLKVSRHDLNMVTLPKSCIVASMGGCAHDEPTMRRTISDAPHGGLATNFIC